MTTQMRRSVAFAVVTVALATSLAWIDCAPPAPPTSAVRVEPRDVVEKPRRAAKVEAAPVEPVAPPPAPESPPSKSRTVRIVVVADGDGAPIAGADVQVDETRRRHVTKSDGDTDVEETVVRTIDAKSGADGVVTGTLSANAAELLVRKAGYLFVRRQVRREENEILVPLVAAIVVRGRVTFADTHEPAPGVPVRAWDTGRIDSSRDAVIDDVVTGPNGRFELAGVASGHQFRVAASKPGYRSVDATMTLTDAVPEIELVLGDGGVMFGVVYDADGAPLPDVDVFQIRPDMEQLPQRLDGGRFMTFAQDDLVTFLFPAVRTDAAGRYEFRGVRLPMDGVPQPRLAAARLSNGRSARSAPATFTAHGERQQRDVRFAKPSSITVTVKTTSPLPRDARVRCQGNGPGSRDVERPAPQDGAPVVFDTLPANSYFVSVRGDGEAFGHRWNVTRYVTLADGESASVELVVDDASRIEGRVVDAEGRGIPSICVEFSAYSDADALSATAADVSGADGSFSLMRLPSITGRLRASRDPMATFSTSGSAKASGAESRVLNDVRPGGPPLTITLRRLGRLVGRVKPVPKQKHGGVSARARGQREWCEIELADDGSFECGAPLVGEAAVARFEFQGAGRAVLDLPAIASGETRDVGEIALDAGVCVDGRLVDVDGRGIAAAQIRTLDDWAGLRESSTDVDGRFRLDGLPKRPVLIKVDATTATPMTVLRLDPAASPATFVVGPGALVKGHVLDSDGKPAAGASVTLRPVGIADDADDAYALTETGADGAYAIRVQAGRAKLRAYPKSGNGESDWIELTATDGETRTRDLRLR